MHHCLTKVGEMKSTNPQLHRCLLPSVHRGWCTHASLQVCTALADRCNANTTCEYHQALSLKILKYLVKERQASLIHVSPQMLNSLVVGAFSCRNGVRDR